MAKITIGGTEYETRPLKFNQLKDAFPLIKKSQQLIKDAQEAGHDVDPIAAMENAIEIVAIALRRDHPELTAEKIQDEIDLSECKGLQESIIEIITESGFEVAKPGEGAAPEGAAASPSTAISTD